MFLEVQWAPHVTQDSMLFSIFFFNLLTGKNVKAVAQTGLPVELYPLSRARGRSKKKNCGQNFDPMDNFWQFYELFASVFGDLCGVLRRCFSSHQFDEGQQLCGVWSWTTWLCTSQFSHFFSVSLPPDNLEENWEKNSSQVEAFWVKLDFKFSVTRKLHWGTCCSSFYEIKIERENSNL